MKYYIAGQDGCKEATAEEAAAQEEKNRKIMEIEDPQKWLEAAMKDAAFIIMIGG